MMVYSFLNQTSISREFIYTLTCYFYYCYIHTSRSSQPLFISEQFILLIYYIKLTANRYKVIVLFMYILIHSLIEIVRAFAPKMSFHFEGQDMLKTYVIQSVKC